MALKVLTKPLESSSNGTTEKRRTAEAKTAAGSCKQNHVFRDRRSLPVSDNLNSLPYVSSVGKQNCSIGAFFYSYVFFFLSFPHFSLENAKNSSFRAQGVLEEEENCHGRMKLLPRTPHLVK